MLASPHDSNPMLIVEMTILHTFSLCETARVIFVCPNAAVLKERLNEWHRGSTKKLKKSICILTDDLPLNGQLFEQNHLILCSPPQWEALSRNWKSREGFADIRLFIAYDLHEIGNETVDSAIFESVVSRMRFIQSQLGQNLFRIAGFSYEVPNASDLGLWIGAPASSIFNFYVQERPKVFSGAQNELPIESAVHKALEDLLNIEVGNRRVTNVQDAVDYLTWSLYYRRLLQNPNYYDLTATSDRHLSDHLSELVDRSLQSLKDKQCILLDEEGDISPLNLGLIAAYYSLPCTVVDILLEQLDARSNKRALLGIIEKLKGIQLLLLLQAYISRKPITSSAAEQLKTTLPEVLRLLHALVDVSSSEAFLKPALASMELSQMICQAIEDEQSPFLQLPNVDNSLISRLFSNNMPNFKDFILAPNKFRKLISNVSDEETAAAIENMCNSIPIVEWTLSYKINDSSETFSLQKNDVIDVDGGDQLTVFIRLTRLRESLSSIPAAICPRYPHVKSEGWWCVLGHVGSNTLLGVRRLQMKRNEMKVKLECSVPNSAGNKEIKVFLKSDCYRGIDQEFSFYLKIASTESNKGEDAEMSSESDV
jgi:hypothetical protein